MTMTFTPNRDGSIEFAVHGDVCIGRIMEPEINEDGRGANARNAYDEMLAAQSRINIFDFSRVTYVNSGAWPRFVSVLHDLLLHGGRLRMVGLTGQPLDRYQLNKLNAMFPRYATIEAAVLGEQPLNPEAEVTQENAMARFATQKKRERND